MQTVGRQATGTKPNTAEGDRAGLLGPEIARLCPRMDSVAEVEIDEEGKFKYILVKVWEEGREEAARVIVRGTAEAEFHPDIYAKVPAAHSFLAFSSLSSPPD